MSTGRTIVPKCWYFGETGVELKPEKFPLAVIPARETLENGLQADPWGQPVPGRSHGRKRYNNHPSPVAVLKKSGTIHGMIAGD